MVSGSANPNSVEAAPPMESKTSNAELAKRKLIVEKLINGEISQKDFSAAQDVNQKPDSAKTEEIERLAKIVDYLGLEQLPAKMQTGAVQGEFMMGEFFFYERRFIEASQIFSKLLDARPNWLRARNLLARSFYFLGNTDRAFMELQYVVANHSGQAEELLDGLFLIGAIAMDSPTATNAQLEKGVGAWKTYLKVAPRSPLCEKIQNGLADYESKKKKKEKNAPESGDVKFLALASFENEDLLTAENKIRSALKQLKNDEELSVALARVFVKSGRVNDALLEFKKIISRKPRSVTAHHYQGMAFMMAGDPQSAIASWEKVLQLDGAYGEQFDLRGRIMIAKNLANKDLK